MKYFGKFIRGKMFEYLFGIFSLLSIFYVSDRMGKMLKSVFAYDFTLEIFLVLAVLLGYMFLYLKCGKEKKVTRNFYEICSIIVCFLLYLVLALWAYDIADVLFRIPEEKWYIIPTISSMILTCYGFVHAKKIYLKEYKFSIEHYTEKETIVLLSDIHVGTFVNLKQLEKMVSMVNRIHADKIIIAGDMFDVEAFDYCDKAKIAEVLRKLRPKGKIYAVLGNHDPGSCSAVMQNFYQKAEIDLLIDEVETADSCIIIGRDDVTTNPDRKSLKDIISGLEKEEFDKKKLKIVIDHNPLGIKEAVENNMDLVLCGHTHKGQFFPANIFTRLAYGKQGYYGYFKENDTQSIVSSGVGFFQMPMRIGSNSEIVILNINK